MLRSQAALLLLAGLASCASSDLPPPTSKPMRPIRFAMHDFQMPSGLRLLVQEDHSAPIAIVVTVVGVGSGADPTGREGLAHMVEHLTFRAHPADQEALWDRLERAGAGQWNGLTDLDATVYYSAAASSSLPDLLRIEGSRIASALAGVDEAAVSREREVVRNELREKGETGFVGSIMGWMQQAVFPPGHPYGRPTGGTHESLDRIRLADVERFVKLHYRTDNMTMMVVGDLDPAQLQRILGENLPPEVVGDPKNRMTPAGRRLSPEAPPPPESPPHGMYRYEGPVSTPELWIGWSLPGGYRETSVLHTFVAVLADVELPDAVAWDSDIASVDVGVIAGTRASMLLAQVSLREGKHPEKSAQVLLDELWKTSIVTEKMMKQMSTQAAIGFIVGVEDKLELAQDAARFLHFTGNPSFLARSSEAIMAQHADEVAQFAKTYLKPERARIVFVAPQSAGAGHPVAAREGAGRIDTKAVGPGFAPASTEAELLKRIARPPGLADFRQLRLANGLEVVIGRRASLPLVTIGLGVHGGTAAAMPAGAAELAEGAGHPDSHDHGELSDVPALGSGSALEDWSVYRVQGLSVDVERMLAVLSDRVRSLRVRYTIVENFKKYQLAVLRKEQDSPESQAERAFWRALYGAHAYGRRTTAADLERIGQGDGNDWIDRTYRPKNAVLAVVGDVDVDEVARLAERWLGDWAKSAGGSALPMPGLPNLAARPPRVIYGDRPGATQGQLVLGCLLPRATPDNEASHDLLAEMIERHLLRVLRQQLGATYNVTASTDTLRGGAAHLTVSSNLASAQLSAALKIIHDYWESLGKGDIDEHEIEAARWQLARRFSVRFTSTSGLVSAVLRRRNLDWPLQSIDHYPEQLTLVGGRDLQEAFAVCHGTQVLAIVGDPQTIRAAVGQAWK